MAMKDNKVYLTSEGVEKLSHELDYLIKVRRPAMAERLRHAIGQGDLSENADYQTAKEEQAFLADAELREFRKLTRHWHALSKTLGGIKIRMRWILHAAGLQGPKINGGSGQSWLLGYGHLLNPTVRLTCRDFLEIIKLIELQ